MTKNQKQILKEIRDYNPTADMFGVGKLSVKEAQQLAHWLLTHIEILNDMCASADTDSEWMKGHSTIEINKLKDTLAVLQNIYEFNNVPLKELSKCGYYGKEEIKINTYDK